VIPGQQPRRNRKFSRSHARRSESCARPAWLSSAVLRACAQPPCSAFEPVARCFSETNVILSFDLGDPYNLVSWCFSASWRYTRVLVTQSIARAASFLQQRRSAGCAAIGAIAAEATDSR
jgi:hypothetical protein